MNTAEFTRIFSLPFAEASAFFRDKLTIESSAWDELDGAAHAKAFTSAGAYHADLLGDLRKMTDKAIAGGMDIREFRQQFRPLVERYGWQLKGGGAAWRSDLIWRTNIKTAYQAGRWQQFTEGGIEYLMYLHNDGVQNPRQNHVALSGMIYPINDPFWTVNYPPNAWGCQCRAVAAEKDEYQNAPAEKTTRPQGWENVPSDGWNYNVGQEGQRQGYRSLTGKMESMDNDLARSWLQRFVHEPAFDRFVAGKIGGEFPVAVLRPDDLALLGVEQQVVWSAAEALADKKLGLDTYRMLPEVIDSGELYRRGNELAVDLLQDKVAYSATLLKAEDGAGLILSGFTAVDETELVKRGAEWTLLAR